MTETRAVILTFAGMTALTIATCFVLAAFDADGTAWGLATMMLAGLGGVLLALVVMHFTPPEERPKAGRG